MIVPEPPFDNVSHVPLINEKDPSNSPVHPCPWPTDKENCCVTDPTGRKNINSWQFRPPCKQSS